MATQMDPRTFVGTMRAWVEAMEDGRHAHAYRKAVDLLVTGVPIAESLDLSVLNFGLEEWQEKEPDELLHGLVGFLLAVSIVAGCDEPDGPSDLPGTPT